MTQRFATLDADGRASGFYADDHGPPAPDGAVPIDDEVWVAWIADTNGQKWNGTALVPYDPPPRPPVIPQQVSMAQARIAMRQQAGAEAGKTLLDDVQAVVDASTDADLKIAWQFAGAVDRNGRFVLSLAPVLGLNSAKLDGLFTAAGRVVI